MREAVATGWVITWEPRPGARSIWTATVFPTRTLAWAHVVADAVENRRWRMKDPKAALRRKGFRVSLAILEAYPHCQHKEERDAR